MGRALAFLLLWYRKVYSRYHCENRIRLLASAIFLVLSLAVLSGCDQIQLPDWLKFGKAETPKSKVEKESDVEEAEGPVLIRVQGRVITLQDFNERVAAYNAEIQAAPDIPDSVKPNYLIKNLEDKRKLLDGMLERELLIAEAIDRGLDRHREVVKGIEILKEELLFVKIIE